MAEEHVAYDQDAEPGNPRLAFISRNARYVALLAAWMATGGSLYMSEVLGWVPCVLCWYQRILMYPLALIIPAGILRRDARMHPYVLVLSVPGMFLSLYHYLYQKTDLFLGMVPCTVGVPCSSDYLNLLGGVVTIPFLALVAFAVISVSVLAARLGPDPYESEAEAAAADEAIDLDAEASPRPGWVKRALPVVAIIGAVALGYGIASVVYRSGSTGAAAGQLSAAPLPTPDAAGLEQGKALYEQSCAACHGLYGEGTPAGRSLTDSALVRNGSDAELLALVRFGRSAADSHNTTGLAMPAGGGQAAASDAELMSIVAYMRRLASPSLPPVEPPR